MLPKLSDVPKSTLKTTGLSNLKSGDPMIQSLYNANPYTNLTYNKSGWQSLLSSIGFRTDYDRWLEDAQVNKAEYDAQVASIAQQNEYNSEVNKVAMMKQAGENPDLLGTSGVSDSASPNQDVNGMPSNSNESGEFGEITQKLWNFGTSVLSMYQIGVGLAKDMMTFNQMQNAVASGDVDLAKNFMKFADDYVLKSAPVEPFTNDREYSDYLLKVGKELNFNVPKQLRLSRRQRKLWNEVISPTYFNSESFKNMTGNWLSSRKSIDEIAKTKSYSVSHPVIHQDNWHAFNVVADELGELSQEVWKISQKRFKAVGDADIAKAGLDQQIAEAKKDYRYTIDGVDSGLNFGQTLALSEGTDNMMRYYSSSVERAMNRSLQKITSRLEQDANDGDLLSAGLLLAFNIFRLSNFKIK